MTCASSAGPVPARDVDLPLVVVEGVQRDPGLVPSGQAIEQRHLARHRLGGLRRAGRRAARARSGLLERRSSTRRIASARRCSTRLRASSPVTLGCSSSDDDRARRARRAVTAPPARARRARGSSGRAPGRARAARGVTASLSTDSSSSPSTRPAVAAQQARVPDEQRDLLLGGRTEIEALHEAPGERHRLRVLSRRCRGSARRAAATRGARAAAAPRPRPDRRSRARGCVRRARSAAPGSSRAGAGRLGADAPTRPAPAARARAPRSPRGTATTGRCPRSSTSKSFCGRVLVPAQRLVVQRARATRAGRRPGRAPSAIASAASSPMVSASCGGWLAREVDDAVVDDEPAALRLRLGRRRASVFGPAFELLQPPAQQRRRHQRRDQHDEQQRRVEVRRRARPPRRPMVAKISPTSPRGSMPRPMSGLSPGRADRADRGEQLADDRDDDERAGDLAAPRA